MKVTFLIAVVLLVSTQVNCESEDEVDYEKELSNKLTGFKVEVTKAVTGCTKRAKDGDLVTMNYRGTLKDDGSEFDSSYKRMKPFTFTLGEGKVIQGWEQGLQGICAGEERVLTIPSTLGYGRKGMKPVIPPDAALIFNVACVRVGPLKKGLEDDLAKLLGGSG